MKRVFFGKDDFEAAALPGFRNEFGSAAMKLGDVLHDSSRPILKKHARGYPDIRTEQKERRFGCEMLSLREG